MPLHNFEFKQPKHTIDNFPDFRTDAEKLLSPASVYNPESQDITTAERLAEELCNISGAFVNVFLRSENESNVDEVFDEDADPVYDNPILMKGVWRPTPMEAELTRWGADTKAKSTIAFSRAIILKTLRRPIRPGDIIGAPQNQISNDFDLDKQQDLVYYKVMNSTNDGNYKYRWLYWKCDIEIELGDKTWHPGNRMFT